MQFILGNESSYKTTSLLQICYDYLEQNNNEQEYAIFIYSQLTNIKEHLIGKIKNVKLSVLERIFLININSRTDLFHYFFELLKLSKDNYPKIITIDKLNYFLNLNKESYTNNAYCSKIMRYYCCFLELIKFFNHINFVISIDLLIKENALASLENEINMYIINSLLLSPCDILYFNSTNLKFTQLIFDFNSAAKLKFISKKQNINLFLSQNKNNYKTIPDLIIKSLFNFEKQLNDYLNN